MKHIAFKISPPASETYKKIYFTILHLIKIFKLKINSTLTNLQLGPKLKLGVFKKNIRKLNAAK